MKLKLRMQEIRWRRRWSGNAYDEYETWNGKVSSIRQCQRSEVREILEYKR
jgi:hypothetical protein